MKTLLRSALAIVLGVTFMGGNLLPAAERAQTATTKPTEPAPALTAKSSNGSAAVPPGVKIAEAISTITGVAISPLLGVGAVGAWKYFKTPEEKRPDLPWFAQPWFWMPALILVGLVFAKDTAGTALPTALKKPLDIAEVFENKLSALVAAGALIPILTSLFSSNGLDSTSIWDGTMMASLNPAAILGIVTIPLALAVFFTVWMVSHVINVLIIVSPFTTVDAALKGVRLALLSSVTLTSFANPYVGAAWALVIIVISYFLSGWAMRLMVFGTVFAWDFLTFRSSRTTVDPDANHVFTARAIDETPVRSYGRLTRNEKGQLVLTYRPWLVLPPRQLVMPEGTYAVGRGLFYPEVVRVEGDSSSAILTLPPRYCGHEESFNRIYQLAGIQNVGIKALWDWVKNAFRSKAAPVLPAAA